MGDKNSFLNTCCFRIAAIYETSQELETTLYLVLRIVVIYCRFVSTSLGLNDSDTLGTK